MPHQLNLRLLDQVDAPPTESMTFTSGRCPTTEPENFRSGKCPPQLNLGHLDQVDDPQMNTIPIQR